MENNFADRLIGRIDEVDSRLVIGIDPDAKRLLSPESSFSKAHPGLSNGALLDAFTEIVIDVAKGAACAVKFQSAFFEAVGLEGLSALSRGLSLARAQGIPAILDAKRGDIGSTAAAYAAAYLGPISAFRADALTVNPYLGPDTLQPFATAAKNYGAGLFVLVKTSNPGSAAFQDSILESGEPLFAKVAESVKQLGLDLLGAGGYSSVGAVVGATYPTQLNLLRKALPQTILLIPGFGAQGGSAQDVAGAFDQNGYGAIVSSSRGIIFAYEGLEGKVTPQSIRDAVAGAAAKSKDEIGRAIRRGN